MHTSGVYAASCPTPRSCSAAAHYWGLCSKAARLRKPPDLSDSPKASQKGATRALCPAISLSRHAPM